MRKQRAESAANGEGIDSVGIYQEYGDLIVALRSEGRTLQQIGDQLGVTRERVRQVLSKHYPDCSAPPSTEAAAKMVGMSYRRFRSIANRLGIQPIARTRTRIRWSPNVLPALLSADKPPSCRVCGRNVPPPRRVYCSEECVNEARSCRNRSPKEKE